VSWYEERRADQRLKADLAMQEQDRRHERKRQDREDRRKQAEDRRNDRRNRRKQRLERIQEWAGEHAVDLLIYPLALVSAVLAIPAMAAYGHATYGDATGYVLPALSELGMWCFAVAVQIVRSSYPERPVWALQLGVWLFAGVAAVLNALHGAEKGPDTAAVMGVASVAGVVAHQLIVAGRRRTAEERAEARHHRSTRMKVNRVRRQALRAAVGEVDPDGAVRLVYVPGRYTLKRLNRGLDRAVVPGMPVDPEVTDWDAALADLVAADATARPVEKTGIEDGSTSLDSGSIATLDPSSDQQESEDRRKPFFRRSLAQLVTEFDAAIDEGRLDPTVVESIRKTLKCSPKYARKLRDYYAATKRGKGGRK
jgi:hypothetical protein